MSKKLNIQLLTMGSAALIVSAGAMAGTPVAPTTALSAHSSLSYGIDGSATFDGNGQLSGVGSQHTAMCSQAGFTCTLLDGSGDGMLQYLVKDTNTGKSHVELIVGSNTGDDGLFLSDTFVRYNGGGTSVDSMANKLIIKDTAELAAADTGFRLDSEWLRGDYQTYQPAALANANLNGGTGQDLDNQINLNVGGVQTFHMDGIGGENGNSPAQAGLVDIQMGTTAANTATGAEDAQAMGVFHTRTQGGSATGTPSPTNTTYGSLDYRLGSAATITLGTNSLAFGATDGASSTFIHQAGFGFNGLASESYTTDHSDLRDFAYVKFTKFAGTPPINIGTPQDPMNGIPVNTGSITMSSQNVANSMLSTGATAATNTVHAADFVTTEVGVGANADPTTAGSGGEFTSTNVSSMLNAWTAVFGTSAQ